MHAQGCETGGVTVMYGGDGLTAAMGVRSACSNGGVRRYDGMASSVWERRKLAAAACELAARGGVKRTARQIRAIAAAETERRTGRELGGGFTAGTAMRRNDDGMSARQSMPARQHLRIRACLSAATAGTTRATNDVLRERLQTAAARTAMCGNGWRVMAAVVTRQRRTAANNGVAGERRMVRDSAGGRAGRRSGRWRSDRCGGEQRRRRAVAVTGSDCVVSGERSDGDGGNGEWAKRMRSAQAWWSKCGAKRLVANGDWRATAGGRQRQR